MKTYHSAATDYDAVHAAIAAERAEQAAGRPYSEAVIVAAEIWLGIVPMPPAVSFVTRSQVEA